MIWMLLLKNWKFMVMGALLGSLVVTITISNLRIKSLKADLQTARQELALCQETNAKNGEAIRKLYGDMVQASEACSARVRQKEKVIARLNTIDQLPEGTNEGDNAAPGSGDVLFAELNGMYAAAGRTD